MPEAGLEATGKRDNSGGRLQGSRYTRRPVCAGGLHVYVEGKPVGAGGPGKMKSGERRSRPEAMVSTNGKPDNAGGARQGSACQRKPALCRRPNCVSKGNPTMREARKNVEVWEAAQAGGHVAYNREARHCERRTARIDIHTEAGLCRRPS